MCWEFDDRWPKTWSLRSSPKATIGVFGRPSVNAAETETASFGHPAHDSLLAENGVCPDKLDGESTADTCSYDRSWIYGAPFGDDVSKLRTGATGD